MPLWLNFLIIFILILVNGFFAAAEMAMVSANQHRIKQLAEQGQKKAKRVIALTNDSTKYLSTIQVAITLAGFLSSALAGSNLSGDVVILFAKIGISMHQTVAMIIVTILLSFVTLVFGELVPKRVAMVYADSYAQFSSGVVRGLMITFNPFVWLLTKTTNGVLALFGIRGQSHEEKLTEDEIKAFIVKGQVQGLYQKEEKDMIENIFRFDDLKASQVMVPRTHVFALSIKDPKLIEKFIESNYSRVLIYEDTIDDVLGILHVKDLFYHYYEQKPTQIDIQSLIRKPTYVPEDMPIKKVFTTLQQNNSPFAILVDEYGGTVGVLTMEDIVEEIVGNLYDEHDKRDASVKKISENTYYVRGDIQIQDLNKALHTTIDELDERYDTLNGLIITLLGKIPEPNDLTTLTYQNLKITTKKIVNHTVAYALIEIL